MTHDKEKKRIRIFHLAILLVPAFIIGIFAGLLISSSSSSSSFLFPDQRGWAHEYKFVSPLLACGEEPFNHIGNDQMNKLEEELVAHVDGAKRAGDLTLAGIYFRQLKGGPWVGVNYDQEFVPGSLLKVPLAMAVCKEIENDEKFASFEVFFEEGNATQNQYFKNLAVEPGRAYTVESLLENMLVRSDNNAAELLAQVISKERLQDAYVRLGIETPDSNGSYSVTVRDYASFFRVLYNATYLSDDGSEKVLEMLSRATFRDGLVAGVPAGTIVAHKFGERAVGEFPKVQLHDCGIVYHPERPYLLCVMTQGQNFNVLASVIKDVSKLVYERVDAGL